MCSIAVGWIAGNVADLFVERLEPRVHLLVDFLVEPLVLALVYGIGLEESAGVGHGLHGRSKVGVKVQPHGGVDGRTQARGFIQMGPGRGQAEDIGGVVAFLCSEEAGWINGQRIEVSGGISG